MGHTNIDQVEQWFRSFLLDEDFLYRNGLALGLPALDVARWVVFDCPLRLPWVFFQIPWHLYLHASEVLGNERWPDEKTGKISFLNRRWLGLAQFEEHPDLSVEQGLELISLFYLSRAETATVWDRLFGFAYVTSEDEERFVHFLHQAGVSSNLSSKAMELFQGLVGSQPANQRDRIFHVLAGIRSDVGGESPDSFERFKTWFLLQGRVEYPRLFAQAACSFFEDLKCNSIAETSESFLNGSPFIPHLARIRTEIGQDRLQTEDGREEFLLWYVFEAFKDGIFLHLREMLSLLGPRRDGRGPLIGEILNSRNRRVHRWFEREGFQFYEGLNFHLRLLGFALCGKKATLGEVFGLSPDGVKIAEPLKTGVTVIGYARNELGLGEDARTTYFSLAASAPGNVGLFSVQPFGHPHPSPFIDLTEHLVSDLRHSINLFCLPLVDYATLRMIEGNPLTDGFYCIALSPWEFDTWPRSHAYYFEGLSEVWAPSEFVRKAYQSVAPIPVVKMPLVVELPEAPASNRADYGLGDDETVFMYLFDFNSTVARKNPFGLIEAFKNAFPSEKNVKLVIKTLYKNVNSDYEGIFRRLAAEDARIVVVDKVMSRVDLVGFMKMADAYVSLHRSEGFGRTLAEAMLLRIPVIATNYSGVVDFFDASTGFPVRYSLVSPEKSDYALVENDTRWAEPDLAHAADLMRRLHLGDLDTKAVVENAYLRISRDFNRENVGAMYRSRLSAIERMIRGQ